MSWSDEHEGLRAEAGEIAAPIAKMTAPSTVFDTGDAHERILPQRQVLATFGTR